MIIEFFRCHGSPIPHLIYIGILGLIFGTFSIGFCFSLNKIFDPDLLKYAHPNHRLLPFFALRRAGLYAMYTAIPWCARRDFGDYNFREKLSKGMFRLCQIYTIVIVLLVAYLILVGGPQLYFCR